MVKGALLQRKRAPFKTPSVTYWFSKRYRSDFLAYQLVLQGDYFTKL